MLLGITNARISGILGLAALALTSCANKVAQNSPVMENTGTGKLLTGTVAAARNCSVSSGASLPLQAIFSALQQNQPPATVSGTEYVVLLNDGTTMAIGESPADSTFKTGDHIVVIESNQTALLQHN